MEPLVCLYCACPRDVKCPDNRADCRRCSDCHEFKGKCTNGYCISCGEEHVQFGNKVCEECRFKNFIGRCIGCGSRYVKGSCEDCDLHFANFDIYSNTKILDPLQYNVMVFPSDYIFSIVNREEGTAMHYVDGNLVVDTGKRRMVFPVNGRINLTDFLCMVAHAKVVRMHSPVLFEELQRTRIQKAEAIRLPIYTGESDPEIFKETTWLYRVYWSLKFCGMQFVGREPKLLDYNKVMNIAAKEKRDALFLKNNRVQKSLTGTNFFGWFWAFMFLQLTTPIPAHLFKTNKHILAWVFFCVVGKFFPYGTSATLTVSSSNGKLMVSRGLNEMEDWRLVIDEYESFLYRRGVYSHAATRQSITDKFIVAMNDNP